MSTITSEQLPQLSVGVIAAKVPGAARVFRKHHIDFCCGGKGTVGESLGKTTATEEDILKELNPLVDGATLKEWDQVSSAEIVDHILKKFHEAHRREIPELQYLARKVEAVHKEHPKAPAGLAACLTATLADLEQHMVKEETVLFPVMRDQPNATLDSPIDVMLHEHDEQGKYMEELSSLCDGFELPAEACASWQALYTGVQHLVQEVQTHINLENHVLFPRFSKS